MVLLPALLLLWIAPFSSCTDRLRTKFWLHEQQTQINEAMDACKQNYSDLFAIYDKVENMMEAKRLMNTSNCSWIAANGCTWSNGGAVRFINLKRNFAEKCCGVLTTGGEWECLNCSSEMYFMCSDYTLITENKTWSEAQLYCKKNQSSLVSIRDEMENKQVEKNLNGTNSVWIGLQYNYKVVWSDGLMVHSDYKQDACLAILPNRLCNTSDYPSTCAPLCHKSFIHVSKNYMSWEEALDYCDKQPNTSGLLRIESEHDQIETERELKRLKILEPMWIGLRQSRLFGFWIWSNGISVGPWTNWKEGRAPEHQTSQLCGALELVNGRFKWTDKDCRLKSRFLCEVK